MTTFETYHDHGGEYPDHQLVPQQGGFYQTVFKGPEGTDVGDLWTFIQRDDNSNVVVSSGWRPTELQLRKLDAGAHVRVALWTYPIPPMAVCLEGPVCKCHGEEMAFDSEGGGYHCSQIPVVGASPNGSISGLEQAHADFTPTPVDDDEDEQD